MSYINWSNTIFNQHHGYWWSGALAPGHQYPVLSTHPFSWGKLLRIQSRTGQHWVSNGLVPSVMKPLIEIGGIYSMIGNTSFHWFMSCYSAYYISHSKAITFVRMVVISTYKSSGKTNSRLTRAIKDVAMPLCNSQDRYAGIQWPSYIHNV